MRKKGLMELKPLKVMNRHIADAKKTEISLSTLENQRGEPGKYRMYCRAAVEKGILKVYLFAVTDIEENINFPRYRLFISRKERRFITYDEKLKKWKKALLESILWDVRINLGNIYVNDCDTKVIQKYLKTMQPAIRALEEFQANIRKEQRIRHDKKLTDSWDQVMKTVSGLPKNWIGWVSKYGITEHYIFYKYQKNGATEGYCTYCKKHVPIRSPKYNQKGQCNVCGQPITFRSVGKSGRFCTKWYRVYLIQRRRKTSGFVLRIFHARTWYKKGGYTDCETTCHEEQRRIFSANGKEISNFVYGLFKQREMRWISYGEPWYYTCCGIQYKGMVYPYTLSDLSRHELKGLVNGDFSLDVILCSIQQIFRRIESVNRLQANSSLPSFTFFGSFRLALLYIFFKFKLPILIGHICTSFRYHNSSVLALYRAIVISCPLSLKIELSVRLQFLQRSYWR